MKKENKNINSHERLKTASEYSLSERKVDVKGILKKRAKELAVSFQTENRGPSFEYIQFVLAKEYYGIEKEFVKEVFPLKEITPLPCTPKYIVGIINVRGKILSVIDLKKFYELPDSGISDMNRVIILNDNNLEFGILADQVLGVSKAYSEELQKTLPTLKGIREDFLKGITTDRVVILDYKKIMNDERIIVNEQV